MFPRYLLHHAIVLPFNAAIISRICMFSTISKAVMQQAHNCSLISALTQCSLWWETSVAFLLLHQLGRIWYAILAVMLQGVVQLMHMSTYLSELDIQSRIRQWGKASYLFFSFFLTVVTYYYSYQYTNRIGFEMLQSEAVHILTWNKETADAFKDTVFAGSLLPPNWSLLDNSIARCTFSNINVFYMRHIDLLVLSIAQKGFIELWGYFWIKIQVRSSVSSQISASFKVVNLRLAGNPQIVILFVSCIWMRRYLLDFNMVIVMDREQSSIKQKNVVNWHLKWT